jgi:uracil-DNA glycosylase family 4
MAHGARCDLCPLKGNAVVPPTSHPSPKFFIVGEGPGRVEERLGAPFLGQSGKLLDAHLAKNGLRRSDAWITNAALCRGESDRENDKAADCCAPRLLGELRILARPGERSGRMGAPDERHPPIIALGKAPTRSILGVKSILAARGFVWRAKEIPEATLKAARKASGKKGARAILGLRAATLEGRAALSGRIVFPMLHPAFILRADVWNPIFTLDFERFGRYMRGALKWPLEDVAPYTTRFADIRKLGKVVSLDIETDGVKVLETKILSVQTSDGENTVVIHPWLPKYAAKLSGWLASRTTVVGHNLFQFDLIVLERHGVKW